MRYDQKFKTVSTVRTLYRSHTDNVRALVYDGKFVYSGGDDRTVYVWKLVTNNETNVITPFCSFPPVSSAIRTMDAANRSRK